MSISLNDSLYPQSFKPLSENESKFVNGAYVDYASLDEVNQLNPNVEFRKNKFYHVNGKYFFTRDGINYVIAGGNNTGQDFQVKSISPNNIVAANGSVVNIEFTWSSILNSDNSSTGAGTVVLKVGNTIVFSGAKPQGHHSIDISSALVSGDNNVTLSILDSYGNSRTILYVVTLIQLNITTSYITSTINNGPFLIPFTVFGSGNKTVHILVDDQELVDETEGNELPFSTTLSNQQYVRQIPAQTHGVHTVDLYEEAQVQGATLNSPTVHIEAICIEDGNPEVVLATTFDKTSVAQYETLQIPFVAYNSVTPTTEVVLSINGVDVSTLNANRAINQFNYKVLEATPIIVDGEQIGIEPIEVKIYSGDIVRSWTIAVTEANIKFQPTTVGLELYLNPSNRSNAEANPAIWSNNGYSATFDNFNWALSGNAANGWMNNDAGDPVLRVTGGATVQVPIHIFSNHGATPLPNTGLTFEFEVEVDNIQDSSAIIMSSFDATSNVGVTLSANQVSVYTGSSVNSMFVNYNAQERLRFSIVIQPLSSVTQPYMYIYINGIISAIYPYKSDTIVQAVPQYLTIGNSLCDIDIYNIRVYNYALNTSQLLNNYIYDLNDSQLQNEIYNRNQIYDPNGNITLDKVLDNNPVMIYVGELPTVKGNKMYPSIKYIDRETPSNNFTTDPTDLKGVSADIQGSSSQYYPRKNLKLKFKNGFIDSEGNPVDKYALAPDVNPVSVYTMKADFVDSSSSHNTGLTKWVEDALAFLSLKVPPKVQDPKTRTTIYGLPICMFNQTDPEDENSLVFIGKYNFNVDKGAYENYGYWPGTGVDTDTYLDHNGDEVWTIQTNATNMALFMPKGTLGDGDIDFDDISFNGIIVNQRGLYDAAATYQTNDHVYDEEDNEYVYISVTPGNSALTDIIYWTQCDYDTNTSKSWQNTWDATYPDELPPITNLREMCDAVTSLYGVTNVTTIQTVLSQYFNIDFLCFFYVVCEYFGLVDSLGNNSVFAFLHDTNNNNSTKWYMTFYDLDTALGINNEGDLVFDWWIEIGDSFGQGGSQVPVYGGDTSTLWKALKTGYASRISSIYTSLSNGGLFDLSKLSTYLNDNEADKWSEGIFNEDMIYKYQDPFTSGSTNALSLAQGKRKSHRNWWLSNRKKYLDGKYIQNSGQSDSLNLRAYTPLAWNAVAPSLNVTLTSYDPMYSVVVFRDDNRVNIRLLPDTPVLVTAPGISSAGAGLDVHIYNVSRLKNIGSLANLYTNEVVWTRPNGNPPVNIQNLVIGDQGLKYSNGVLQSIGLTNLPLLEKLDVTSCVSLKGQLDLSGCPKLKEVYCKNTSINSVLFGEAGILTDLQASSLTGLVLKSQLFLYDTRIKLDSNKSLATIVIENCPHINPINIIDGAISLASLRCSNLAMTAEDPQSIYYILFAKGIDDAGNPSEHAYIRGTITFTGTVFQEDKDYIEQYLVPNGLTVNYTGTVLQYVPFVNPYVKSSLIAAGFDTNNDTNFSLKEIRAITSMNNVFVNNPAGNNPLQFDEFEFFTGVSQLEANAFSKYNTTTLITNTIKFQSITLPYTLKKIGAFNFYDVSFDTAQTTQQYPYMTIKNTEQITEIEQCGFANNIVPYYPPGSPYDYYYNNCPFNSDMFPNVTTLGDRAFYKTYWVNNAKDIYNDPTKNTLTLDLPYLTSCGSGVFESAKYRNSVSKVVVNAPLLGDTLPEKFIYAFVSDRGNGLGRGLALSSNFTKLGAYSMASGGWSDFDFTNIVSVGDYACSGLTLSGEIDLSNVTYIGQYAFNSAALTSVVLNKTADSNGTILQQIGYRAFNGCTRMTSFELPPQITTMINYFYASGVTEFTVPSTVTTWGDGDSTKVSPLEGTLVRELTLPATLTTLDTGGGPIVAGMAYLETLHIETTARFPATYAMYNLPLLKTLTFSPEIKDLSYSCFIYNAPSLEVLDIPETVETMHGGFFYTMGVLDVVFPAWVSLGATAISFGASSYSPQYKQQTLTVKCPVTTSNSVSFLADSTYNGVVYNHYPNLRRIKIEQITGACPGVSAHTGGDNMTLDLGPGVTSIGSGVSISYANRVSNVLVCRAVNPPTVALAVFDTAMTAIYVPDASVNSYKAATNWSTVASLIQPLSTYIED